MVIWLSLRWWYGAGWQWAFERTIMERLKWCNENFSVLSLMRTWFAPFKQTYSGGVRGSLDIKIHAFFDRIISRFIGAIARTALIFIGLLAMLGVLITGLLFLIIWPLIPAALPISLAMMAVGVGR